MAKTKFRVGQLVDFNPARATIPVSIREYKVLKALPCEQGEQRYRIKSIAEVFERLANESELSTRS